MSKPITTEKMMEVATREFSVGFNTWKANGELHYEANVEGLLYGPMLETELYWFLSGYFSDKDGMAYRMEDTK